MGTLSLWTISPRPEYGPAAQRTQNKHAFSDGTKKGRKKNPLSKYLSQQVNKYDGVALKFIV